MNYIAEITAVLERRIAEIDPDCPGDMIPFYALLVLTTGISTGRKEVHDAWACWRNITQPDHKDLLPYDELAEEVQLWWDEKYAQVVRDTAQELG